ncbi:hypothetical protein [Streptomyces mobaraensis]|uniref:Uncharacterized protein n=1 Tax=Streptomyces mobaraensis TaxID=35621 RepID=A0A5N5W1D4_STRMB|nr:hypothetical protein [Streptomyces mobaraensis]KAB7835698.1 hypothetical protein FRZ00_26100 [Streptomyces mobaraensis]
MPDETKIYERTEDGITTRVTAQEALAEGGAAMTDRVTDRAHVRTISRDSGRYDITYTDGRHVVLAPVDEDPRSRPSGFRIGFDGDAHGYDSVTLFDGTEELAVWTQQEWTEDPSVVFAILNAAMLGFTRGPDAVRARLLR